MAREGKRIPEGTIDGVLYLGDFLPEHEATFGWALRCVKWDERIQARKTASFGLPYDYAGLTYAEQPFPAELERVRARVAARVGEAVNNCLLNYYPDGRARMGFHSDSEAGIVPGTGVAIVSLGVARPLRFRATARPDERLDYLLAPGSLLFMPPRVQAEWQHALPRSSRREARISLTFRTIARP
jgi:alkylated DNA repair dioxygenase AlkB